MIRKWAEFWKMQLNSIENNVHRLNYLSNAINWKIMGVFLLYSTFFIWLNLCVCVCKKLGFVWHFSLFLKQVSSACQDCVYLIKNKVNTVMLWNIFQFKTDPAILHWLFFMEFDTMHSGNLMELLYLGTYDALQGGLHKTIISLRFGIELVCFTVG